jgi:alpha-galactosidase
VSEDVNDFTSFFMASAINSELGDWAAPGGWNDPDMLIGTDPASAVHMKPHESRTQFSLCAIMAAPLMLGTNVRNMNAFDWETYTNREVIAVNQDPLGVQGIIIWENCPERDIKEVERRFIQGIDPIPGCQQIWGKALQDGGWAVLLINWVQSEEEVWIEVGPELMSFMGFDTGAKVRDLWEGKEVGAFQWFKDQVAGCGRSKLFKLTAVEGEMRSRRLENLV